MITVDQHIRMSKNIKAYNGPSKNRNFVVNHKNENKLDNRITNLEWCSASDNIAYSIGTRTVVEYENGKKETYLSMTRAARAIGITRGELRSKLRIGISPITMSSKINNVNQIIKVHIPKENE
ncbi:hypothetical protein BJ944DRAFT_228249 [Cunninghamella echinulata]|nr:hypothetical protein BJ944DRAFT_228249 [Cunninghamella echinulata]